VHETVVVLRVRRGPAAVDRFWRLLQVDNDFEIAAFAEIQARAALSAFERLARAFIPGRGSIWPIALPTRSPRPWARRSCSKETTFPRPT
jgi:hypothetical protein